MATFTANTTTGVNMANLFPGMAGATVTNVVSTSGSVYRATYSNGLDLRFTGSFLYFNGFLISGTYTQIEQLDTGTNTVRATLTGVSGSMNQLGAGVLLPSGVLGGADTATGNDGADVLYGGAGNDTLHGLGGEDTLFGGDGDDLLNGGIGSGGNTFDGGSGTDVARFVFASTAAVIIDLNAAGPVQGSGVWGTMTGIERLGDIAAYMVSGGGNDVLVTRTDAAAVGFRDFIESGSGNDVITLGRGADTVAMGTGASDSDVLVVRYGHNTASITMSTPAEVGGAGDFDGAISNGLAGSQLDIVSYSGVERFDVEAGSGYDVLVGGSGDDILNLGKGAGTADGQGGQDVGLADLSDVTAPVTSVAGPSSVSYSWIDGVLRTVSFSNIEQLNVTFGKGDDLVTGTGGADVLTGGDGHDAIAGAGGKDVLRGGAGNDSLHGGDGNDVIQGGLGYDVAQFLGPRANYAITKDVGAGWTVTGTAPGFTSAGSDALSGVEAVRFADGTFRLGSIPQDFTGAGYADLLWREAGGTVYLWQQQGATRAGEGALGLLGNEWQLAAKGDLYGDGMSDMVWRHSDGTLYLWAMAGQSIANQGSLGVLGQEWSVRGTGDFDGDGRFDLAFGKTDGSWYVWYMNGFAIASFADGVLPGSGQIQRVADFDGDAQADWLWRKGSTGDWVIRDAGGVPMLPTDAVLPNPGADWTVAGAGDLNGDAAADLVWRNMTTGDTWAWFMNGGTILSTGYIARVGLDWSLAEVADYTGEGKADLVWRNAGNGLVWMYAMDGTAIAQSQFMGLAGANWTII
ncbi:MAG: FG-GAP-like repeat-containing protein [Acetobacteraceae bacterium]|nr:FG-GAP-like repeat-containing protein [Acetobacteraceae bacterium]